jgi:glutathione synthase/RimK-type ligase-like ATP-grasp enzyme
MPTWTDEMAAEIELCPVLLQQCIRKAADWRVTVVDEKVFACRIDSQKNPQYALDMRRGLTDLAMAHELLQLPDEIAKRCVKLVEQLDLRFGAIDLAEDLTGKMWFLEINPNGQWAWIEDRTGAPISETIAKALLNHD